MKIIPKNLYSEDGNFAYPGFEKAHFSWKPYIADNKEEFKMVTIENAEVEGKQDF